MSPAPSAKIRIGPAGLHYFNRSSGLNVLFDEVDFPKISWHAAPRQISIALTNACDLRCSYCYAPKNHAILDSRRVCAWLSEFDEHGALGIGFGGGEPTLHPRFAELCEFAAQRTTLAVTFTTHGHHLSPKLLSRIEGRVNFIRLSMDGIGSTYERLRGRSFRDFTTKVREASSVAPIGLNFVVNADTLEDLDSAIDFAQAEGVREFLLLTEQRTDRRSGIAAEELQLLQNWVRNYRGKMPLAVSARDADRFVTCDPCNADSELRAYAHINAVGQLQRSSFEKSGVQILESGVMVALRTLQESQPCNTI
ncbi:MoaA/NifB/PqqE/SkfB family radical SAM enzyme [Haloferula luteola]|uniref:MoaA/NifB/PqqE/SkfB family radical SAM enzyme n=1 Tax=Haloferula luteola TaxID=595692 RepID=A0A840V3Q9_9BACT|nr:MoaA/NifB/PqqE/SkfB family radical SAM enzyme [Haloferula luteola]